MLILTFVMSVFHVQTAPVPFSVKQVPQWLALVTGLFIWETELEEIQEFLLLHVS